MGMAPWDERNGVAASTEETPPQWESPGDDLAVPVMRVFLIFPLNDRSEDFTLLFGFGKPTRDTVSQQLALPTEVLV
jgi:hypothetical protein